jgi:hypothetical protein
MNRIKSLLLAGTGIVALSLSEAIYRLAIVPRLPKWQSVPIWWWLVQMLPLVAAVVLTGLMSRTVRDATMNGLSLVVPAVLVVSAYGALTGQPIGHDIWVQDPVYWLIAIAQVGVCLLGVVLTATISRSFIKPRHGV